jgi:hypothetical protein
MSVLFLLFYKIDKISSQKYKIIKHNLILNRYFDNIIKFYCAQKKTHLTFFNKKVIIEKETSPNLKKK